MLPFKVRLKAGESPYKQLIYAVKKALVTGRLQPGEGFPSVRKLSQELKINPNTVHKAVTVLIEEGLLEVRPGIGTVVKKAPRSSAKDRRALLAEPLEEIVVEAKRLRLSLEEVTQALEEHWQRMDESRAAGSETSEEDDP